MNMSQIEFYKGILSRATANRFEKEDPTLLKLKHIPILLDRLSLSFDDLLSNCFESFTSEFDQYNNRFQEISSILASIQTQENSANTHQIEDLIIEIEAIYKVAIQLKDTEINYYNLYFLIKVSFSDYSQNISQVDYTDFLILKDIYKRRNIVGSYDYKVFANWIIMPFISLEELDFLFNRLYPLDKNASPTAVRIAHLALTNIITKYLRDYDFKNVRKYILALKENLEIHPSYEFKIVYLHDLALLEFLESNYTKAASLNDALRYIDIINEFEPENSTKGNRMKEATISLIEKNAKSKELIALIATEKNNIDFKKNIPPHIVKG